jgi:hypothetical protein
MLLDEKEDMQEKHEQEREKQCGMQKNRCCYL